MSWELVSFLILGGGLLGGFAWYERSRPPAQVVALVAALAALAIAGRVALGAFPNVKPLTTDVIVFAGYALGGAPGFAVGALTALVSNFWFGQGPWTPWQMAGWGLCGILGALLALGWRNAGRFSLAATCGFAAIVYGALMNFSLMATYGGELSLRRFAAFEVQAIPFEVAHAGGNIAFALIAGPAMVRMLARFRERFEWDRRATPAAPRTPLGGGENLRSHGLPRVGDRGVVALLLVLLAIAALAPARAQASDVSRAADWLESVQNSDGGFGSSPGDESGAETTCWAMLGLAAAGRNPLDVRAGGHTPVDFLRKEIGAVTSAGDLARTIVALESAGLDPRGFAGQNLVARLSGKRGGNGSYEGRPNTTAFAVMALRSAGVEGGISGTLDWLRKVQNDDGGWGDLAGSPSNADGTGAVLQALSPQSKASGSGLRYLTQVQRKGGGFSLGGNGVVNTQSTAWAIEGIRAAGGYPNSFRKGGASAPEYLAANQEPDGSYRYAKPGPEASAQVAHQTPVWVTGTALVAAAGDHYPVAAPPRAPRPKPKPKQTPPSQPATTGNAPLPTGAPPPSTSSESPAIPPSATAPGAKGSPPATEGAAPGTGSGGVGSVPILPEAEALPNPAESTAPTQPGAEAAAESDDGGSSSPAGAVVLGLLAGAALFGLAWAARRGWMRWRYGL